MHMLRLQQAHCNSSSSSMNSSTDCNDDSTTPTDSNSKGDSNSTELIDSGVRSHLMTSAAATKCTGCAVCLFEMVTTSSTTCTDDHIVAGQLLRAGQAKVVVIIIEEALGSHILLNLISSTRSSTRSYQLIRASDCVCELQALK